jgi:arylsulfatase A-like enzyme
LRAEEINHSVFRILDTARARRSPFFLFVNYMDGHTPYVPPAPFHRLFPGRDPSLALDMSMDFKRAVFRRTRKLESREIQHFVSQYDGAIAYLDQQLGKLWARLEQQKLLDNTLVIITADHGEAFGEHDVIEHSVTLYRHQTFVPLLIKYPRRQQPAVSQQVASQVDLLPTVLKTVGLPAPSGLPGHALPAETKASTSAVSEAYPHAVVLTWRPDLPRIQRSLTVDDSRFILSSNNTRELYALSEDPKEQRNLCGTDQARAKELESSLEAWQSQTLEYVGGSTQQIDPETLERLKSLGYVQ